MAFAAILDAEAAYEWYRAMILPASLGIDSHH
jgi:hypothetical protein